TLDLGELVAINPAGEEFTDRLKSRNNREIPAIVPAGLDRAAINKDRRDVEPGNGHHRAGHVLVAPADCDQAVHLLGLAYRFDRVCDHLTRDERIFHAFGPHRDAVTYGNGAKYLRHQVFSPRAFDCRVGKPPEAKIAGGDGAKAIGNADDRLFEIAVTKTNRPE